MPNKQQQKVFRQAKINALLALIDALEEECLPSAPGLQMKTGAIEEYLDQSYRPLQPRALLTVLREADIPHDSNYRFLPWAIYDHRPQLKKLAREYIGAPRLKFTRAPAENAEAVQEAPVQEAPVDESVAG